MKLTDERIEACITFCSGVETEKLVLGSLAATIRDAVRLREQRDALLEALQAIMSVDSCSALSESEADAIDAKARAAIAQAVGKV